MRWIIILLAIDSFCRAADRCSPCHARIVENYRTTGMGSSITTPADRTEQAGALLHARSGTALQVLPRGQRVIHQASRSSQTASYDIAWAIGSGHQGKSYIVRIGDSLFQSPISWYSERRSYDLSPGFENDQQPDFFRPVTPECLFCHAGAFQPVAGTQNRYRTPALSSAAITCERCHGDPTSHLVKPSKSNIVNPAALPVERRDAICEQCHLSGEARIPNPGKQFSDFQPGMRLEDVFSVYVPRLPNDAKGLKVVSHSEQLALSRCRKESGSQMWCATCHDPHSEPADKVSWFRQKCIGCHDGPQTKTHEASAGRDCAGCHMPRTKAYDGGHTAFHDHRIRARQEQTNENESPEPLKAWREPDPGFQNRNLGLAYVSAGSKSGDSKLLAAGWQLLRNVPPDGPVETARGALLIALQQTQQAIAGFRRAVREAPNDSLRHYNLAAALFAAGDTTESVREIEAAIQIEPLLEDAYALAARIEPGRAEYWKRRYRKLVPQRLLP